MVDLQPPLPQGWGKPPGRPRWSPLLGMEANSTILLLTLLGAMMNIHTQHW